MSDLFNAPQATETLSLKEYAEKAYLDYSMYVILDRALPVSYTHLTLPTTGSV